MSLFNSTSQREFQGVSFLDNPVERARAFASVLCFTNHRRLMMKREGVPCTDCWQRVVTFGWCRPKNIELLSLVPRTVTQRYINFLERQLGLKKE